MSNTKVRYTKTGRIKTGKNFPSKVPGNPSGKGRDSLPPRPKKNNG